LAELEVAGMDRWPRELYPWDEMSRIGIPWAAERRSFTSPELESFIAECLMIPEELRRIPHREGGTQFANEVAWILKIWRADGLVRDTNGSPHKKRSDPYSLTERGREAAARLPSAPSSLFEDLLELLTDGTLSETERQQLVKARLGQGQFRDDVLTAYGRRCAVTGCDVEEVLRASHIKPWRDCNNKERLDPDNGLALIANLDALFDRHLITFSDDGRTVISCKISQSQILLLGPMNNLREQPSPQRCGFLRLHRKEFQRNEQEKARLHDHDQIKAGKRARVRTPLPSPRLFDLILTPNVLVPK
jgi:hypothetical protein